MGPKKANYKEPEPSEFKELGLGDPPDDACKVRSAFEDARHILADTSVITAVTYDRG